MTVPVALSILLPVGIKGLFCAMMVMGLFAGDSGHLHSWGSIFVQDVVLPLRKTPMTPRQHIWALRSAVIAVAMFAFTFSLLFTQTQYIQMWWSLTSAVFVGGAGGGDHRGALLEARHHARRVVGGDHRRGARAHGDLRQPTAPRGNGSSPPRRPDSASICPRNSGSTVRRCRSSRRRSRSLFTASCRSSPARMPFDLEAHAAPRQILDRRRKRPQAAAHAPRAISTEKRARLRARFHIQGQARVGRGRSGLRSSCSRSTSSSPRGIS